ncbi:MAG: AAA family ATPase [Nostocaceae cyanobacterium]|nr:AAA family ATPase [Nostocaceae cyanobacterium]
MTPKLDLQEFFASCDPSRTLVFNNSQDWRYYIDFASVRGGKVIEQLQRTITRLSPNKPTCQLFTGHIGCGKSTELRRLEAELRWQDFHVVYFESTQDLDMADVDVTDIMLAITRQVSESLSEVGIELRPGYLGKLLNEIIDFLQTPIEVKEVEISLPLKIAKITAKTKDSPKLRSKLRQYLEPQTNNILQSINEEVLGRGNQELKQRFKKGLVVIVDNLDRVDPRAKTTERSQPEYLFVDRGEQLRKLNCHLVYTIPLVLMFSNEVEALKNRLGGGVAPKVLPMVPVQLRDGSEHQQGMAQLRQMVLARAFPTFDPGQRLNFITEVFDSTATLDRLCRISGGHVRNLLGLLYSCLQAQDPPISRECLENSIRDYRESLVTAITDDEWKLLREVTQRQRVTGEADYQTLLRSLFVFEYHDNQGRWFGINPVLAETREFQP